MGNIMTAPINAGFSALNSLNKDIVITNITAAVYDPSTGGVTQTTSVINTKGRVGRYKDETIASSGGLIKSDDRKVILMQKDFTGTIEVDSTLTVGGETFNCISVKKSTDENLVLVQIRK